jgi:hypothetical protein
LAMNDCGRPSFLARACWPMPAACRTATRAAISRAYSGDLRDFCMRRQGRESAAQNLILKKDYPKTGYSFLRVVRRGSVGWPILKMNDALRAAVFARDKGICAFSGLSVWYLDHGTAPFSHADWVDHIKPRSRKGDDTLDNLVCASYFYNRKKLNNAADRQYLFREGRPTDAFFWNHGELTVQQATLLRDHAKLDASDWYFNRAIFNVMVAIGDELAGAKAVRTREYWLGSARKRVLTWRKLTGGDPRTFQRRGLVRYPKSPDTTLMLSLANATDNEWSSIYRALLKLTRSNEAAYAKFLKARSRLERMQTIRDAEAGGKVTAPLLTVMKTNNARL